MTHEKEAQRDEIEISQDTAYRAAMFFIGCTAFLLVANILLLVALLVALMGGGLSRD